MSKKYTPAAVPSNELDRLQALFNLEILDTEAEEHLDQITKIAAKICGVPVALVSLVDKDRQWFKSKVGIDVAETPRDLAFCAHAIIETKVFEVIDATADERFQENPLVTDGPKIRFYAGAQLKTSTGHNIGTLCVVDSQPKKLSDDQIELLETLARQVILILERRKSANVVKRRETILSNILSSLPDRYAYLDTEFRYRYVNAAYQTLFGQSSDELVGKRKADIIGSGAFQKLEPFLERALTGEQQDFEIEISLDTAVVEKLAYLRISYIPDRDPSGKILGLHAIISDNTELKQAEHRALQSRDAILKELAESQNIEDSFRNIFENFPIGVIKLDESLRFRMVNSTFSSFIGYSKEELSRLNEYDITHHDDLKLHKTQIEAGTIHRLEKRYVHKSGNLLWGLITYRSLIHPLTGERMHFSTVEDVTEIKLKKAELLEAQAKLVQSAKFASLGEMAGGLAHEINNPLSIISARTDIMLNSIDVGNYNQEKTIHNLRIIQETSERIGKIIKGLQVFSRASTHDPMVQTPAVKIIEQTIALCKERFKNAGVSFMMHSENPDSIECRPTEISQIILNLLGNSFDAVQGLDEKWIKLEIYSNELSVSIRVLDSGRGIEAKLSERIMEPFFTTKEAGKGTGLGLSISKKIAETHGGTLRFDSSEVNTCFVLELPKKQINRLKLAS